MKSIIIKTIFILLALFLVLDAAEAQMNLNEIADAEPFHKVAQIKGTENLLRDYFSGISNENDTLYVVLCPLMFCPRCEAEINVVQELLYMRKPDNPMVMIASSPNEQAARKYVAKKFYFEDVIYDTDLSFKSFLAFRTEEPRIPFIMKIDRKSGRLLTGGDYIVINDEFADALIRHTEPMPYYGELWEGTISFQPAASNCEGGDFEQAEIFSKMAVPSDSNSIVSNITFPKISNGYLSFADELDNSIYLYSLSENADNLLFVGRFAPNESEELAFVSIEHEKYFQLRANNMVLAMCLTGSMINRDTLAFSVSLPNLKYDEDNIAYYNAPAVIFQNIHNEKMREFIPMELFGSIDSITYIGHESFYYSEELDLLFFASFKGYPYFELTNEHQNPFEECFYKETPLYTVYDTDKKPVGRIGQLGQIHMDLHLGYAYCNPKITSHGSTIAVTDGTSGTLLLYDSNNFAKPISTIDVFQLSADSFTVDNSLYGTEEYAYQFQDDFQNMIVDIIIDSNDDIYTLSLEDGCYFKKTFDRKGNLKSTILVPNTINTYQLEITGLCLAKNKVLAVGFYYDKEKHNMVLLD